MKTSDWIKTGYLRKYETENYCSKLYAVGVTLKKIFYFYKTLFFILMQPKTAVFVLIFLFIQQGFLNLSLNLVLTCFFFLSDFLSLVLSLSLGKQTSNARQKTC